MAYFHYRCGERITLLNDSCTAVRNDSEFDHGIVVSAEPLVNDVLFEIKIDRKVNSWSGSLVIGVTECDPMHLEFPACASKLQNGSWIMAGNCILKDGILLVERYGIDLDKLSQDDRVGLMRTSEGDLMFYINGDSQGVAVEGVPPILYAVVDLYGKCVQVTITSPTAREHNNDDCLSGSSVLGIDNDILNVTLGGDLSELSLSSSNSLDIRMDMNVSLSLPEEIPRPDKLRFHERCGSLVKLSNGQRTAERRRPLDEFNNGVVMTHRPLRDSELFEIRIDRLVDKWSGSIEMGITTHNPSTLMFPATMTNMRSGTIMMSGCGILTNGKGTRREYGDFNLDELSEGDRVGMMRKPDGNLHYFINGLDQGIAATRVPTTVWGVIDLYGMTIKVSIVERDEREEQNLMTRRNARDQQVSLPDPHPLPDYYDRLTFHHNCGTHAEVINNGRTAHRPNAIDDFNNGVVLTARPLKPGEMFEVRLDRIVSKWAGSIEIGVTTHSPTDLEFPSP
ncbi:neuralized [Holotrichia oblita]|uniref:Neuralized n=1 Tax=Holotrichia oblita TaxID=644536 RepID=A0ACB9TCJ6_HOLOL|nr:neuralized [Holotrichia oblita]